MLISACTIEGMLIAIELHILYLNSDQCTCEWLGGQLVICPVEVYGEHRKLQSHSVTLHILCFGHICDPIWMCISKSMCMNMWKITPHKVQLSIWPNVTEPFCIMCYMISFMWYMVDFIGKHGQCSTSNAIPLYLGHWVWISLPSSCLVARHDTILHIIPTNSWDMSTHVRTCSWVLYIYNGWNQVHVV